jgi:hypothetical protein
MACELLEAVAVYGGRAVKFVVYSPLSFLMSINFTLLLQLILQCLQLKALKIYLETNSGIAPGIPNNIFRPSSVENARKDELSIFSGKTHTVPTTIARSTNTSTSAPTTTRMYSRPTPLCRQ